MARNALITGLPRSGTTLVVALLNRLDDVVALHEPMNFSESPLSGSTPYDSAIAPFLKQTRSQILKERRVRTRLLGDGTDNPYGSERNERGLRTSKVKLGSMPIEKDLSEDFLLAI